MSTTPKTSRKKSSARHSIIWRRSIPTEPYCRHGCSRSRETNASTYLKRRPILNNAGLNNVEPTPNQDESTREAFWLRLDRALESLPIDQKTAFVFAEIEELSYAEIARIEQTTIGTVKSRIHRAKTEVARCTRTRAGEPLMSDQKVYDDWIANRRSVKPPTDLATEVMSAVEDRHAVYQRLLLLRFAHYVDRSKAGRWLTCLAALFVGSTPFVVLAYVARLFVI